MREDLLKGLSEEQIAKIKACKTTEEMLAVAKEEGVELTDDQLEAVSGGACTETVTPGQGYGTQAKCPKCNRLGWCEMLKRKGGTHKYLKCPSCGAEFWW
jgi:hypothetical protein